MPALGKDVVQEYRVDATEHQVAEGVHVVFVCDGGQAEIALRSEQDVVGESAPKGADTTAGQIAQLQVAPGRAVPNTQDLAKLIVGDGHGHRPPPGSRVFDAAQADLGVATSDRLVDG